MRKLKLIIIILMAVQLKVWAADAIGDFRSAATGAWNGTTTWEICIGAGSPGTWDPTASFPANNIAITVTIRNGDTVTSTGNITGTTNGKLIIDAGGSLSVTHAINGNVSSRFPYIEINGNLFTSNTIVSSTFIVGASGYFRTSYSSSQGWWTTTYAPSSITLSGTVEYNRDGNQTMASPGAGDLNYNNLIITGSGIKTPINNIIINGLLTINSGATMELNSKSVTFYDMGLTNNGIFRDTYSGTGASLNFYGATATIDGSGTFPVTFYSINIGDLWMTSCDAAFNFSNELSVELLTVDGTITFDPNCKLTVTNAVDYWGTYGNCFTLQSNATITSSLIIQGTFMNNGSGGTDASVGRYITGGINTSTFAHLLSSPVSDQNIGTFLAGVAAMVYHDETDGTIKPMSAGVPSTNFLPGRGYFARRGSHGVVTFTGKLNVIPVSFSLVNNGFNFGWNCVGNPFTSSFSITDFLSTNSALLNPSYANCYVYVKGGTPLYQPQGNGVDLQSGQGFYVKSAGTGSLSFTSAMQVHQNPAFYKKSSTGPLQQITLKVKNALDSTFTNVIFGEGMTMGLDVTYDAGLFGGKPEFMLYTKLLEDNGVNFFNQYLPDMESTDMVIPVGFDCAASGLVSFTANISSLPTGYKAILEDRLLNIFTDLEIKDANYQVAVPAGTSGTGRFYLHTLESSTGINVPNVKKITTFAVNKEIYIKGLVSEGAIVSIYDPMGRKILTYRLEPSEMNIVNLGAFKDGVYIVKVIDKGVLKTDRVFISE